MQHVVQQRHLVGAGRRVRDLHREYIGPDASAAGHRRRQRVLPAVQLVGHRLGADRPGRSIQAAQTRSRWRPRRRCPHCRPAWPVNVASLVSPGTSQVLALRSHRRARRVALGGPDRHRQPQPQRVPPRRRVASVTWKLTVAVAVAVSPSPSVTVNVADASGTGLDVTASAVNAVRPVRLHLQQSGPDVDHLRIAVADRTPAPCRQCASPSHRPRPARSPACR